MATIPQSQPQPALDGLSARLWVRLYALDWETAAYLVVFVLAVFTRFVDLESRAMSHDEALHTKYSWDLYARGSYAHNPMMHGPLLFHMTALAYALFGDSDFSSRIYVALLGVALVLAPVLFRRWVGRTAALLSSVGMLVSPYMLYYSRYIRHDIPAIFFALLMVWAIFRYLEDDARRMRWLYLVAACLILLLASKEVAFIYVAVIGSFFALLAAVQLARRERLIFDMLAGGLILGAVVAMGLIVVVTIAPANTWLDDAGAALRGLAWSAVAILVPAGVVAGAAWMHFRGRAFPMNAVLALLSVALVVALLGVALEQMTHIETDDEVAEPATPGDTLPDAGEDVNAFLLEYGPLILVGVLLVLVGGGLVVVLRLRGNWGRRLDGLPAFDALVMLGTLILPWLAPFAIKALGYDPTDYQNFWPILLVLVPVLLLSVLVGVAWRRQWLVAAAIFYALYFALFTTLFTNGQGLATGMVGSLGYWLEQQGVRRGNQPQYYYVLQMVFYEFLPLAGAIGAGLLGLGDFFRRLRVRKEAESEETLHLVPSIPMGALVLVFFGYLAAANFIAYTLAGEKMPWLTTHLTVPMIFLTGWVGARGVRLLDWENLRRGGWMLFFLLPVAFIAGARVVGDVPSGGLTQDALIQIGHWFGAVLIFAVVLWGISRANRAQLGRVALVTAAAVLVLITARSAWMASFINDEMATEFMVYAHSAPAVKDIMARIETLSLRFTDALELNIAYDNETSWPYNWYLRHYPNRDNFGAAPSVGDIEDAHVVLVGVVNVGKVEPLVKDNYYRYDTIRMWWPMQEYLHIKPQHIDRLFALGAEGAALRQGLFDIWWNRDYSAYALATGRSPDSFSASQWPVNDRMSFFVRKDVAAKVWTYGIGDEGQFDVSLEDPYTLNTLTLTADAVLGEEVGLAKPRGMAAGPDGGLYVADAGSHRVVVFDMEGKVRLSFGQLDVEAGEGVVARPGHFKDPWDVAVAADGTIFVADTWNHRVQVFTPEGEFVTMWGHFGQDDDAPEAFYGPRGIAVYEDEVFVVDTGNKRIRVYDFDGDFRRDIGSGGAGKGELSEPVGIAVNDAGLLFVADTWNRRVQVLTRQGDYVTEWRVSGWYGLSGQHSTGNLPFLTLDDRGNVYVADADTCRVIVFDQEGNYRYNFGQCAASGALGGLAVDEAYRLHVADVEQGRIYRYELAEEPELEEAPAPENGG